MAARQLRIVLVHLVLLWAVASPVLGQRLPTLVVPVHYDLAFSVDLAHARFSGTETIRVDVGEPTSTIVLNAAALDIAAVTIGAGASAERALVTLDAARETATFTVARPLAKGPTDIHIRYTGVLNDNLRGFYLSHGRGRNYAVTQFESTDARRAFPCFDEPAFKATFAVTLTIARGDTAISNGRIVSDRAGPGPAEHTVTFSTTPIMSPYLVAMAVGDFACAQGATDGIPIRICATRDKQALTAIALESAEHILAFYNTYFAVAYPFGKLDVLAVPDFAAGAMENTAAIFCRETDLLADARNASVAARKNIASALAHEMAHQWFGDLVTMAWWDDLWLNEGFATWMANRPLTAWKPEWDVAVDEVLETQAALNLDGLQSTRPVRSPVSTPAEIDAAFDTIAYQKGAAVLRMIEGYVGADIFRAGVNRYLGAHAYGTARSEDFWNAIAAASGKPIDRIMPTFLTQPGAPLLDVSLACPNGRPAVTLAQQRLPAALDVLAGGTTPAGPEMRWQVPYCVRAGGSPTATCDVLAGVRQSVDLGGSCPSWVLANAGSKGYYRTAYPPDMLRAMAPGIQTGLTAAERLSLVADEWALVLAGRHSAADYLALAAGFGPEKTAGVLAEVVGRLRFIHSYLTSGPATARFEAFARSLFAPRAAEVGFSTEPGSNDARRAIEAVLIDVLGTVANDPDVVGRATTALEGALNGTARLDPTLAGPVVRIAAAHGNGRLYERLMDAARRAASPGERDRYVNAGASFRDPVVIARALQRTLSSDVRTQDASLYLSRFFDNPVARPLAWAFLKEHWDNLEAKITIYGGDTGLAAALGSFCDAAAGDDIKGFFAAHPMRSAERELNLSFERINNCVALKTSQTTVVSDWLASR